MLILGLLLAISGLVYAFLWFAEHKFEYLSGVKPSEQLDQNFYKCMVFMGLAMVFLIVGFL